MKWFGIYENEMERTKNYNEIFLTKNDKQNKKNKNKIITTTQSTVRNDVLFTTNRQHKQPQAVK